ncbi:MAG: YqgE/AlgH family protein [Candidatus Nanopelagicales bacterium]
MDPSALRPLARPPARDPRPGDLLVAAPAMGDPRFRRTVVYVLQHDDDGSAGVVINRRFEGELRGLELPDWALDAAVVHAGGPVSDDSLLGLAAVEATPAPLRRSVGPGISVVDLDRLSEVPPFGPLQLFVGYAGWGAGQLAGELAQGDWLVVAGDPVDVLLVDPDDVWRHVLRRQPGAARLWATLPDAVIEN